MGFVVRRRNRGPRGTLRRRCAKKSELAKEPADHALGRSKGGFTTKLHVKTDGQGHILGLLLTAGQCHESTQFEAVMESGPLPCSPADAVSEPTPQAASESVPPAIRDLQTNPVPETVTEVISAPLPSTKRPKAVAGDKAYGAKRIRDWCAQQGIEDVIPTKSNEPRREKFDKEKYRDRNIVERAIGWLKECRRVLTRFEKYAVHYLAIVQLAVIQRYLTVYL